MKKRIIVLMIALSLSINSSACGGNESMPGNNSDGNKTEESEQAVIESESEDRELKVQAENQTTENVTEIFDILNELKYQAYTCDGLPEYQLTAPDGTVYAINFSEKWVWRKNSEQAELSDALIAQIKKEGSLFDISDTPTEQAKDDIKDSTVQGSEMDYDHLPVNWGTPDGPEIAVENYYANTVFELVSYEIIKSTKVYVIFEITSKKNGILVEPNRSIELRYEDEKWKVINEGYGWLNENNKLLRQ